MPDTPIPTTAIDPALRERVLSLGLARRLADPVQPQSVDAEMLDALRDLAEAADAMGYALNSKLCDDEIKQARAAIARAEVRS